eukprot:SAG11_NODE_1806_length_4228_cov_6.096391_2_plen_148_part_00
MEIIEKLSEELGEKEMKMMNLEKETRMAIKTTNELEIATMLLMENFITKGIDECIEEGIDQYTISCGGGFFKEKKEEFIKNTIIPYLTTHTDGDSMYATYKNGYYYYRDDCMCPYEIVYDGMIQCALIKKKKKKKKPILGLSSPHSR